MHKLRVNMDSNSSNNSIVKAALILALAIVGFFVFLYFQEKQDSDSKSVEIRAKTEEVDLTNFKLDSLSHELDIKISELAALGARVEQLEKVKASLQRDKKNLLSGSKSANVAEYTSRISEYELIISEQEEELRRLRQENTILGEENTSIASSNTKLKTDNTQLKTEKDALNDSVVIYAKSNKELKEKVNIGAALRPQSYLVTAINRRGKEKDGDEFKGKKVDRIKVSFKLAENALTKKENKVIIFRLLDPRGNVISDMAMGSGTFTFAGKQTVYTAKQTINYTNSNQIVDFVYDRESKYEKGSYTIELYSEGFRIGQTSFVIK